MKTPTKVGIVGATGYTGQELLGILEADPRVEVAFLAGRSAAQLEGGQRVEVLTEDKMAQRAQVVMLATPHGVAKNMAPKLLERGARVIDLSHDFRLPDASGGGGGERPLGAVYGLSEWFGADIAKAKLVANPGCYATAMAFCALPLAADIERAVFFGASGFSGAGVGKSAQLATATKENFIPYRLTGHPHEAEVAALLPGVEVAFTPHLLPCFRGLCVTAQLFLRPEFGQTSRTDILEHFRQCFAGKSCVQITEESAQLAPARGTNSVTIGGFEVTGNRVVITAALDNLRKGAASAAAQNLALMMGWGAE